MQFVELLQLSLGLVPRQTLPVGLDHLLRMRFACLFKLLGIDEPLFGQDDVAFSGFGGHETRCLLDLHLSLGHHVHLRLLHPREPGRLGYVAIVERVLSAEDQAPFGLVEVARLQNLAEHHLVLLVPRFVSHASSPATLTVDLAQDIQSPLSLVWNPTALFTRAQVWQVIYSL